MKCKNIECENETINGRVYCSLKCRNIYVNKYMRSYDKVVDTNRKKREKSEEDFYTEKKLCMQCNDPISYEKRFNSFCSSSCSATYYNTGRSRTDETKKKISETLTEKGKVQFNKSELSSRKCIVCDKNISYERRSNKMFCSSVCYFKHNRKYLDLINKYKSLTKFKFHLKDYSDEFDFDLIREHGWYKAANRGNNLNGVSRDHIYSVVKGFEDKVNPLLLAHPANCQLLRHNDNISKGTESITIDELLDRISTFEDKYGKYYNLDISTYIEYDELK